MSATPLKSYLDLIDECDSFPYADTEPEAYTKRISSYYHLQVASHPETTLGFLLPSVALSLQGLSDWALSEQDAHPRTITLKVGKAEKERSEAIAKTTAAMRTTGHWKVLDKWRDELYPVYGPFGELLFTIERSASPLFGVVTYGVHMTCFERDHTAGSIKIWVPRRSKTKQTYPSMLDNSVAGGIAAGEKPFESLVREAMEEASLPETISRSAQAAGCITYFYIREKQAGGEVGLLQPECQYVYDLELTEAGGIECKLNDDEVEAFELLTIKEVQEALRSGQFKPNCALIMIDFLIRHGVITPDKDRNFAELVSRMHRRLEFPMG